MGGKTAKPRSIRTARAFTIVEILAALLVIAVAIIGIAALYSDQVRISAETRLPLQAAALAESMAARIRATQEGRDGFATTVGIVCNPNPPQPKAKPVSAVDAAANEASCWEDEVERALPSGLGSVSRDTSTTPVSYVVSVSWSAPGAGTASYVIHVEVPSES